MITDQNIVFVTIIIVLILFAWGKWRYDIVSLMALLVLTVTGIVPISDAFLGFGHPAVITVAAVLIVSRCLFNSGMADFFARAISKVGDNPTVQLATLVTVVTICSAFMNNVGALALFLPVAIRMARKNEISPSFFLMPIAFGSLLGGLITQIGTPPNIIVSLARAETLGMDPFQMFDFAPVGVGVALAGLIFIVLIGWRLVPERKGPKSPEEKFEIEDYIVEVQVPEKCKFIGKKLKDLESIVDGEIIVVGHIREGRKRLSPSPYRTIKEGDLIIVKAIAEDLQMLLDSTGVVLAEAQKVKEEDLHSEESDILEAIIAPKSPMEGQTAQSLKLRSLYGINLLAISRETGRLRTRLNKIRLRVGDVLLLQGNLETLQEAMPILGCLPLAERGLRLGQSRRILLGIFIFGLAIVSAALGILPVQVAFVGAALVMILAGFMSLKEIYTSIDWPVIVLLGAMIPVSNALETTGGAKLIADTILIYGKDLAPWISLTAILVVTMFLSDIVNNNAAALLMIPIAVGVANGIGASPDPFLMGVALGASCAFLTPIGHQSNALVMVPGGYRFGDYWRMGLPLEVIIVTIGIPLIMYFWPLGI